MVPEKTTMMAFLTGMIASSLTMAQTPKKPEILSCNSTIIYECKQKNPCVTKEPVEVLANSVHKYLGGISILIDINSNIKGKSPILTMSAVFVGTRPVS